MTLANGSTIAGGVYANWRFGAFLGMVPITASSSAAGGGNKNLLLLGVG